MASCLKTGLLKLLETNLRSTNQLRCYARWTHRHPRKVLTSEEYDQTQGKCDKNAVATKENNEEKIIELNPEVLQKQTRIKYTQTQTKRKPISKNLDMGLINIQELDKKSETFNYKIAPHVAKKKTGAYKMVKTDSKSTTDMLETVIDVNGEFIYTKLKNNDPIVGQLLLTVKSRKEQIKKDLALLEGKRLIKDALEAQCILKNIIFSRKNDIEHLKPYLPKSGAKIFKMSYKEIQMWSDLTTTPGIMGIFKTPDVQNFQPTNSLPLTIICDNIREPGNLGAVLRTAAGVGAQSVILTKGCVDLWDTKVLRSACGAHFRLQIHKKVDWPHIKKQFSNTKSTILIADNKVITESSDGNSQEANLENLKDIILSIPVVPYYGIPFKEFGSLVLIVGGETEGISEESYRLAADCNGIRLNIPLNNEVESLNTGTALGIIMFEIKRQMLLLSHTNEMELSV